MTTTTQGLYRAAEYEGFAAIPDPIIRPVSFIVELFDDPTLTKVRSNYVQPPVRADGKQPTPYPRRTVLRCTCGDHTNAATVGFGWETLKGLNIATGEAEKKTPREIATARKNAAAMGARFLQDARDCYAATKDKAIRALVAFLERDPVACFRDQLGCQSTEELYTSGIVVFRYGRKYLHDRKAIVDYFNNTWLPENEPYEGIERQCCVTGKPVKRYLRRHPKINIPGGGRSSFISFNMQSCHHYGQKDGRHLAPMERHVALSITAYLQRLMLPNCPTPRDPNKTLERRFLSLGNDEFLTFFTDHSVGEVLTTAAHQLGTSYSLADLTQRVAKQHRVPLPRTPDQEAQAFYELLQSPRTGRAPEAQDAHFYLLGLKSINGRLATTCWIDDSVRGTTVNLKQHFEDMNIHVSNQPDLRFTLSVLMQSVLKPDQRGKGWQDHIPAATQRDMYRAALTGSPYPQQLLNRALPRCWAAEPGKTNNFGKKGRTYLAARIALIRGIVNRRNKEEVITMALDKTNMDPGYRLGRLVSLSDRVQKAAYGPTDRTASKQFFGRMRTSPEAAYRDLGEKMEQWSQKMERDGQEGLSAYFGKIADEIHSGIDTTTFPRRLSRNQQMQFVVGYYHQRAALWEAKQ